MALNAGFHDRIALVATALTDDPLQNYIEFDKAWFDTAVFRRGVGQKNYGSMMAKAPTTAEGEGRVPSGKLGTDYSRAITVDGIQSTGILPPPGSRVVLKVDVEGSECRALAGALHYLKKVHIDYAAIE